MDHTEVHPPAASSTQQIAPPAPPPPPAPGDVPVLQKLSNPPFPKGKFPLLGILASVYEHVTTVTRAQLRK
jgi:hypothetical protein